MIDEMGKIARHAVAAAVVLIAAVGVVAGPATEDAFATPGSTDAQAAQDLAAVRRATARFHDVAAAEDAGYHLAGPCTEIPGVGAMGLHYVNFALIGDPALDLERPEVLLYIPSGNGPKLTGVEYLAIDADQSIATANDRPVLFGEGFDGPMEGHEPGMPVHYDLHVWAWHANPAGTFAQWNTSLSCS